jgi:hypothetical protein
MRRTAGSKCLNLMPRISRNATRKESSVARSRNRPASGMLGRNAIGGNLDAPTSSALIFSSLMSLMSASTAG